MRLLTALLLSLLLLAPSPGAAVERGIASWYGPRHHGKLMANGERFNQWADTVAHRTLPLGTVVTVRNPANGRIVTATVTDRGPYIRGRTIDLSRGVARRLDISGIAPVEVRVIRKPRK